MAIDQWAVLGEGGRVAGDGEDCECGEQEPSSSHFCSSSEGVPSAVLRPTVVELGLADGSALSIVAGVIRLWVAFSRVRLGAERRLNGD
jgi:hypothetical protein